MSVETLRDRFAMAALTGLLAHPQCGMVGPGHEDCTECVGREAYTVADAALAARGDAAPLPTGDAVKQQMLEALRDTDRSLAVRGWGTSEPTRLKIKAAIAAAEKEAAQ